MIIIKTENPKRRYLLTCILSIAIAFIVAFAFSLGFLGKLENMAQDGLYQREGYVPEDIKIIKIDEETLDRLGPYNEWDRSYFAQLISTLNDDESAAPKVIGVDIVFGGSNGADADRELVESAKMLDNVVFASTLQLDSYTYKDEKGAYYRDKYVAGEEKPYQKLDEVSDSGFTNAIFDSDGFVRRAYTSIASNNLGELTTYDSFATVIAGKLGKELDYDYQVEIAYTARPGKFEAISMADVLDGKVPEGYFKNSIVLVGAYEEAMMDAYRVPIDYSMEMYGVELQANIVNAFLNDKIVYRVNVYLQMLITFVIVALFALFSFNNRLRTGIIAMVATIAIYIASAMAVYGIFSYKMNLLAVPMGIAISLIASFLYRHYELQKSKERELRGMLFSMAEAMAEAIEGRTPYNANHTKNVARRCIEMLDFINEKHRKKETELYFTEEDKQQLYLAAMLHDVGKMDVPLEVMDKATKLGSREKSLRDRLKIISLKLEIDALNGRISRAEADERQGKIEDFLESLGAYNCGRPLKDEEWQFVNEISETTYVGSDGEEIPYLLREEVDDLHIKAGTLSEQERLIMQSHVVYTDKILSHMEFGEHFKDVRSMAANHHELLNGKGYPHKLGDKDIDTMTRILTIMDIYDSLIADDRPYKKPKPVKVAFDILREEAEYGKVDKTLLEYAKELYLKEDGEKQIGKA